MIGGAAIALRRQRTVASRGPGCCERLTCNGYAQLCCRRLDQVVFAGTHNSMSAADSPGWLIANQGRTSRASSTTASARSRSPRTTARQPAGARPAPTSPPRAARSTASRRSLTARSPRAPLQRFSGALGFGGAARASRRCGCATRCASSAATSMASFLGTDRQVPKAQSRGRCSSCSTRTTCPSAHWNGNSSALACSPTSPCCARDSRCRRSVS